MMLQPPAGMISAVHGTSLSFIYAASAGGSRAAAAAAGQGGGEEADDAVEVLRVAAFLRRAWPRLEAWYQWFNTTQAGALPTSFRCGAKALWACGGGGRAGLENGRVTHTEHLGCSGMSTSVPLL